MQFVTGIFNRWCLGLVAAGLGSNTTDPQGLAGSCSVPICPIRISSETSKLSLLFMCCHGFPPFWDLAHRDAQSTTTESFKLRFGNSIVLSNFGCFGSRRSLFQFALLASWVRALPVVMHLVLMSPILLDGLAAVSASLVRSVRTLLVGINMLYSVYF